MRHNFVLYLEVWASMAMKQFFVFRSVGDYGSETVLHLEVWVTMATR